MTSGDEQIGDVLGAANNAELESYGALHAAINRLAHAHLELDKLSDGCPHPATILDAMRRQEAALRTVIECAREHDATSARAERLLDFFLTRRRGVVH